MGRSPSSKCRLLCAANEKIVGETIVADGAAVRTGKDWYGLKYRCDVAPDHGKVVAFEFQLGTAVPRDLWDEYGLTDDSGDDEDE